jgi:hypothetical protein
MGGSPMPLALSDDQMAQVLRCAEPLNPADRSSFLRDVAAELDGKELGDGLVLRTCRDVQRRYWRAPIEGHHAGKNR